MDLDQVLNDFEYSELTDQYNNSAKFPDNSPAVQSHNVSKHSINNVFHSLNEYLNTNIHVNNLEIVDNNVNDVSEGHCINSYQKIESISEEKADSSIPTTSELQKETQGEYDLPVVNTESLVDIEENKNLNSFLSYNINNEEINIAEPFSNEVICESVEINPEKANSLKFEDPENNVDLHTELQNVVGDNFAINYDKKIALDGQELKSVVGFDQALHFDDQEINKLLSELEEDDEINIDVHESQLPSTIVGCEIEDNNNITYNKGNKLVGTYLES